MEVLEESISAPSTTTAASEAAAPRLPVEDATHKHTTHPEGGHRPDSSPSFGESSNSGSHSSSLVVKPVIVPGPDGVSTITTVTASSSSGSPSEISFEHKLGDELGHGSFGRVIRAVLDDTKEPVAIKTVLQDSRYINRELDFLLKLDHQNIIKLSFYYFTHDYNGQQAPAGSEYLHLALEYLPESLHIFSQRYCREGFFTPLPAIKLAMYQVFRALAYLHSLNIAHRDVKPHNILINTKTGLVKLCDLGSMKQLNDGSKSVSYICTRHYRAPELLCGSSTYTVAIDAWSAGCTFAELLRQEVLFAGNSSKDQLSKILSVMGSLSERNNFQFCVEIGQSPQHIQLNSPPRDPVNLSSIVPVHVPFDAVVLLTQLLQIVPSKRATMSQALASAWFDDLRVTGATLRSGAPLPPLFNFTSAERVYLERKEVQAEALAPLKQAAASGSPNVKTEGSPLSSSHSRTRRYSLLDLPSSSDDNSPVGFARSTNLLFRCNSYSMINMIHISSNSDSPKS
eukprot:m.193659 g.193659  ORF g.193659 m.193659 type:complete len:512 (-) comp53688_c0_seq3:209-1744(-)